MTLKKRLIWNFDKELKYFSWNLQNSKITCHNMIFQLKNTFLLVKNLTSIYIDGFSQRFILRFTFILCIFYLPSSWSTVMLVRMPIIYPPSLTPTPTTVDLWIFLGKDTLIRTILMKVLFILSQCLMISRVVTCDVSVVSGINMIKRNLWFRFKRYCLSNT